MAVVALPCTGIKPGKVSLYTRFEGLTRRSKRIDLSDSTKPSNYQKAKSKEGLSVKASNRMKDAIRLLIDCSEWKKLYSAKTKSYWRFKNSFVTLTLPSKQVHSDKEIHEKIFVEFIRFWKRRDKELLYVWKAETQENGNLHYHLITNAFIHHDELRAWWNYYCNKLGYIDRATTKDANSTDVHAVKGVKSLVAYAIKYMSKKEEGRRIPSIRRWYCSKALLLPTPVIIEDYHVLDKDFNAIEKSGALPKIYDYAVCYYVQKENIRDAPIIWREYSSHIERVKALNRHQTE